jgi:hypothetical protein
MMVNSIHFFFAPTVKLTHIYYGVGFPFSVFLGDKRTTPANERDVWTRFS